MHTLLGYRNPAFVKWMPSKLNSKKKVEIVDKDVYSEELLLVMTIYKCVSWDSN